MDAPLSRIGDSTPVRPPGPRRERPRREGEPGFRLPDPPESSTDGEAPATPGAEGERPVAPPESDEPGVRLDISG